MKVLLFNKYRPIDECHRQKLVFLGIILPPLGRFNGMKYFSSIFALVLIFGCSNPEGNEPLACDDDALFSKELATGEMFYMPCYDSWAIHMDEMTSDGGRMNAASLDIPVEFREQGLRVSFDACFYPFDLPLIIADPAPIGLSYVIKDFTISQE